MNLAHIHAIKLSGSVAKARQDFDGSCIDFAGDLTDETRGARLAYFDNPQRSTWSYHATMELNGIIHDLWQDKPMRLSDYMKKIGAETVEYPAEEAILE